MLNVRKEKHRRYDCSSKGILEGRRSSIVGGGVFGFTRLIDCLLHACTVHPLYFRGRSRGSSFNPPNYANSLFAFANAELSALYRSNSENGAEDAAVPATARSGTGSNSGSCKSPGQVQGQARASVGVSGKRTTATTVLMCKTNSTIVVRLRLSLHLHIQTTQATQATRTPLRPPNTQRIM